MREIKFRAWDKIYKHFHEGDIVKGYVLGEFIYNPEYEVSQYTGLKDKNGKEIYEGDLVKFLDGGSSYTESGHDEWEVMNIGQIIYDEENAFYDVTNKDSVSREDVFEGGGDFEVIGNIYENPELVGETNE